MKTTAAILAAFAIAAAALPLVAGDYFIGVGLSLLMYVTALGEALLFSEAGVHERRHSLR